jgi:hypothetical protein
MRSGLLLPPEHTTAAIAARVVTLLGEEIRDRRTGRDTFEFACARLSP